MPDLLATRATLPGREALLAAIDSELGAATAPLVPLPAVPLYASDHHATYDNLVIGAAISRALVDAGIRQRSGEGHCLELALQVDVPEGLALLYVHTFRHYLVLQVLLVDLIVQLPNQ